MSESVPSLVVTSDMLSTTTSTVTSQDGTNTIQPPADMQSLEAQNALMSFWQNQLAEVQNMTTNDFKDQYLPLARIKKIMKMDEDVKMISAEAPLLFAKAAQMFITELSLRAWVHTEENKRRTLQVAQTRGPQVNILITSTPDRNDIATAITKFDQFDFLIDIVPREELKPSRRAEDTKSSGDGVQYFYNIPQQPNQPNNITQSTSQANTAQGNQVVLTSNGQILQLNSASQASNADNSPQIIQLSQPQEQTQTQPPDGATSTVVIGGGQQQATGGVVVNTPAEHQSAVTPQLIQQLISHRGISPSDIHSIQITPDGQIQIIKVAPNSSENL